MNIRKLQIGAMSAAVLLTCACKSQFVDKAPDSQSDAGFTVANRMQASENLDSRIARLEETTDHIRNAYTEFKKLVNQKDGSNYNFMDFVVDMSRELKKAPVEIESKHFVRHGHVELKVDNIAAECRFVDVKLESTDAKAFEQVENIPDSLVFSVRTCRSGGLYLPVVTANYNDNHSTIDFNAENFKTTLNDILIPVIQANPQCDVQVDASGRIDTAQCVNIAVKISDTQRLLINEIVYHQRGSTRFSASGTLFENDRPIAAPSFPPFELNPIPPPQ